MPRAHGGSRGGGGGSRGGGGGSRGGGAGSPGSISRGGGGGSSRTGGGGSRGGGDGSSLTVFTGLTTAHTATKRGKPIGSHTERHSLGTNNPQLKRRPSSLMPNATDSSSNTANELMPLALNAGCQHAVIGGSHGAEKPTPESTIGSNKARKGMHTTSSSTVEA